MRTLVTGGAGFIGSVASRALAAAGHDVAIFDDFSTGHDWAVGQARVFRGDIRDRAAILSALRAHACEAVIHFAAKAIVPESVADPILYFDVNVGGGVALLSAMRAAGVKRIVFSSTAAVYGAPEKSPIGEDHPLRPINPYGRSKLAFELLLEDERAAADLAYASLRYFNACGADPENGLGEARHTETHLVPLALKAALTGRPITVCGTDYPTRDGTCVRDYIDVRDLADAHLRALERLSSGSGMAYNLGSERGATVREVIAAAGEVLGRPVPFVDGPRRAGDPPALVASCARAKAGLGWTARRSLADSIRAQLDFMKKRGGLEAR